MGPAGQRQPEQEQREVPGPVWNDWAWPGTGMELIKSHFRPFKKNWQGPFTYILSSAFTFFKMKFTYKCIKGVFQWSTVPKQDQESVLKQDHESLSAPSLDCLCKARASSWSCSRNPYRTGNLSLLLPWTVSARQASLSGQLVSPFAGPLCYSCFSVKSSSPVLLGP